MYTFMVAFNVHSHKYEFACLRDTCLCVWVFGIFSHVFVHMCTCGFASVLVSQMRDDKDRHLAPAGGLTEPMGNLTTVENILHPGSWTFFLEIRE